MTPTPKPSPEAVALVEEYRGCLGCRCGVDAAEDALLAHIATVEADAARWRQARAVIDGVAPIDPRSLLCDTCKERPDATCVDTLARPMSWHHHSRIIGARMMAARARDAAIAALLKLREEDGQ